MTTTAATLNEALCVNYTHAKLGMYFGQFPQELKLLLSPYSHKGLVRNAGPNTHVTH